MIGAYRAKPTRWEPTGSVREDPMSTRLDQRGWTAAQQLAPCVLCHQPAITHSPRGKPCHWTCAMTWTNEREDQDHSEARAASALRAGAAVWCPLRDAAATGPRTPAYR